MATSGRAGDIAGLLYSGRIQEAEQACKEVLATHPKDFHARGLLSQVYSIRGMFDEALVEILQALRIKPRQAELLVLHGEILMHRGRYRNALVQFDKALKYKPGYEGALSSKANTYLRMGKPEKARQAIEKEGALSRKSLPLGTMHARVLIKCDQAGDAVELLEGFQPLNPRESNEWQCSFWHALGDAHQKLKQWDEACKAYDAGNLVHSKLGATIDQRTPEYELLQTTFTAETVRSLPRSKIDSSPYIFIVGMPRCGSTLTEQIIDSHPGAHGIGESNRMPELAAGIQARFNLEDPYPGCVSALDADQLQELADDYIEFVRIKSEDATHIVDKQLGNIQHLGLIQSILPEARIIHCRRHPMDQGLSCWTKKMPASMSHLDNFDSIGRFWRLNDDLWEHWKQALSLQMIEIRYEDLVQDTEGMARKIIDFCGLDWDPTCLRFWENKRTILTHSSDQVRQPIYDTAKGRHVAWGDLLDPLREALGDSIQKYEAGGPGPE